MHRAGGGTPHASCYAPAFATRAEGYASELSGMAISFKDGSAAGEQRAATTGNGDQTVLTADTPHGGAAPREAGPQVLAGDPHDDALVANVHPPDWVNPEPAGRYNLVVIGAGTAGLVTAAGAAGLGARVALVERHLMGGDCLNVGCVPSKALIRSSRAHRRRCATPTRSASRVPGGAEVDFAAVMERMRAPARAHQPRTTRRARFRDELGVDVFLGEAPLRRPGHASRSAARRCASSAPSSPPARAPPRRRSRASPRPATCTNETRLLAHRAAARAWR